ncbi:hypothetical protein Hdeb2414_s0030g00708921 [Helianthus debilis subsp. tardiflorus]
MVHRFLYIPATRAESDLNLNSFCQFNPGWKSSCSTFPDKGINLWRRPPAPRPRLQILSQNQVRLASMGYNLHN